MPASRSLNDANPIGSSVGRSDSIEMLNEPPLRGVCENAVDPLAPASKIAAVRIRPVRKPAQNMVVGDGMPKSDGFWSSSLWWPTACMDRKASSSGGFEGIDPFRHKGTGIAVFNDGHSEARKDNQINPPVDPGAGNAKGLINSEFWDPLQRGRK